MDSTNNINDYSDLDNIEMFSRKDMNNKKIFIEVHNIGLTCNSKNDTNNSLRDNECEQYLTISKIDTTFEDYFKNTYYKILNKHMRHDKLWI